MTDEQRPWRDAPEWGVIEAAGAAHNAEAIIRRMANVYEAERARADAAEAKLASMSEADDVFVPMRRALAERADAAEAQRDRLAAALEIVCPENPFDMHGCLFCGHARHGHHPRCRWALGRAALADVPDDRARRRDEAYRACVEALSSVKADPSLVALSTIVDSALALARQVEA